MESPTNDFERPASSARADNTPGRSSSQRLGRPDWVDAALRQLAVGGLGSLSIERIATELGATKGSFYWHFTNRSALIDAALAEWERRDTDQLIERASEIDDPRERLRWLFRVVFSDAAGVGIDTALLADAQDPAVAAALARVATKRLSYIEAQYKQMGTKAAARPRRAHLHRLRRAGPAPTQHTRSRSPRTTLDQLPLPHPAGSSTDGRWRLSASTVMSFWDASRVGELMRRCNAGSDRGTRGRPKVRIAAARAFNWFVRDPRRYALE